MAGWEERKERVIELLDLAIAENPDNPIQESYTARNIVNYLSAIKQINEIMRGERVGELSNLQ